MTVSRLNSTPDSTLPAHRVYANLDELQRWQVFTRPYKLGHQQKLVAHIGGHRPTLRKGRGMTFSEVRLYQAGDDVRHIDWKVTARTQKPHTKLFTEEHERPVFLIVEQSANLFFGTARCFKSVLALDVMAILGWATLNQADRIGGVVFGAQHGTLPWVQPKRHQQALLSLCNLALQQQQTLNAPAQVSGHWCSVLEQVRPWIPPASKVFLIGDLLKLDSQAQQTLIQLRQHADLVALHLEDPFDCALPEQGGLQVSDGHSVQTLQTDAATRKAYAQAYQDLWQQQTQALGRYDIPLLAINSADSALESLAAQGVIRR